MPEQSALRCRQSIRQRGIAGTSAAAFARMSVNSLGGQLAKALGLRGPSTTLSWAKAAVWSRLRFRPSGSPGETTRMCFSPLAPMSAIPRAPTLRPPRA